MPFRRVFSQCYAPLAAAACGRNLTHRAIHVFGCTANSCRNKPGSWRVFRSQAPETEPQARARSCRDRNELCLCSLPKHTQS